MKMNATGQELPEDDTSVYSVGIYPVDNPNELPEAIVDQSPSRISDRYEAQIAEYLKISYPGRSFSSEELETAVGDFLAADGAPLGNWVYYPWLDTAVRLLDESMFRKVRTSRNQYKITPEEQELLYGKTVGVVGLSVGQAAAVTLAMESVGGTLRLADFDTLDLSNLNRLRAGLHQLGLPKTIIAARQIAEIDPYLKVELFHEGVTPENAASFMNGLDLVVEECDSLPVKLLIRHLARSMQMPVIMDTSDRGMVDVERFDIEPERPVFHGKLREWEGRDPSTFTADDRTRMLFSLVDYEKASEKARKSFAEIGKSITTWPQLASAVTLGGAMMTDTARRILLGEEVNSGRYYVDLELLIGTHD